MKNVKDLMTTLLDSSLITATKEKKYNAKLVQCGDYCQIYLYENMKIKNELENNDFELRNLKLKELLQSDEIKKNKEKNLTDTIEFKNINRSKLECQRLAKANMKHWKTFITLTFSENITDINYANKRFKYYVDKVRRVKKDFKYLCITEFQKRGAIHYHLLTNIEINSELIPKQEKKSLYNPNTKTTKILEYYNLKYWTEGFSSAEPMNSDSKKVVGYISKYMTKDIDNRLFGHRRYFNSQNLIKPKASYINLEEERDNEYIKKIIQDKYLIYQNKYTNTYDNTEVSFLEFLKQ